MEEIDKKEFEQEMDKLLIRNHMNKIGLDDTLDFKCRGCGKCCKNRRDILLSPQDVFRIAKYLDTDIEGFLDSYCNIAAAHSGMVVAVTLKSIGGNDRCPFLNDRKCGIHAVKPVICAMFPVGRVFNSGIPKSEHDFSAAPSVEYVCVDIECDYKHKKQTVREWLNTAGVPIDDAYYIKWNSTVTKLARYLHMAKKRKATDFTLQITLEAFFQFSYVDYDMSQDFLPQFEQNMQKVDGMIDMFIEAAQLLLPEQEEGDVNGKGE